MFDIFLPIFVMKYLSTSRFARDTNEICEDAAIGLFYFLAKGSSDAALNASLYLKPASSSNKPKVRKNFLRISKVMIYVLQNYGTNDVIAETDATSTRDIHLSKMLPTQYAEALVTKSLRCGEVYNEYVLEQIFPNFFTNQFHIVFDRTAVRTKGRTCTLWLVMRGQ